MSTASPHAYVEDPSPGSGRLRPRGFFRSDAPLLELDGTWRFRLAEGLHDLTDRFEAPDFDDSRWDALAVPSCWQMTGLPQENGNRRHVREARILPASGPGLACC